MTAPDMLVTATLLESGGWRVSVIGPTGGDEFDCDADTISARTKESMRAELTRGRDTWHT